MVAYSFKKRFVQPIRVGLSRISLSFDCPPKRQTIRAFGKRRHARPGETLQLYCGMRTKQCFKIGEAQCVDVGTIRIHVPTMHISINTVWIGDVESDAFAQRDGFSSLAQMQAFWREEHPDASDFFGLLILWEPI